MDEAALNLGIRRFLKQFGVAAQREIEKAVEAGLRSGQLKDTDRITVRARLEVGGTGQLDLREELPLG
jgi:hypothetical protein